jgi:hypothetical protein
MYINDFIYGIYLIDTRNMTLYLDKINPKTLK